MASRRNPVSQSRHDAMVATVARGYERRGYEVYAAIKGYPAPPLIYGHRPDVLAVKNGHRTIVEVETLDSLVTRHAEAQHKAFLRARRQSATTHYRRVIAR